MKNLSNLTVCCCWVDMSNSKRGIIDISATNSKIHCNSNLILESGVIEINAIKLHWIFIDLVALCHIMSMHSNFFGLLVIPLFDIMFKLL